MSGSKDRSCRPRLRPGCFDGARDAQDSAPDSANLEKPSNPTAPPHQGTLSGFGWSVPRHGLLRLNMDCSRFPVPRPAQQIINLTDELDRFVLQKVESGRYENASEVVRAAIDEGDASGVAGGDVFCPCPGDPEPAPKKR